MSMEHAVRRQAGRSGPDCGRQLPFQEFAWAPPSCSGLPRLGDLPAGIADDTIFFMMIEQVRTQRRWWGSRRRWRRIFERFDPDGKVVATIVYESRDVPQELCLFEYLLASPVRDAALQEPLFQWSSGRWVLTRFPCDAALPGLPRVLRTAAPCEVVRYRPHKRCTLRLLPWQARGAAYAKFFADNRGAALHQESAMLWEEARRGGLQFQVAKPLTWHAETRTLYQSAVAGNPVWPVLASPAAPDLAFRMGQALASLHGSALQPAVMFDARAQWERTEKYARGICLRHPELAEMVAGFLVRLHDLHISLPDRAFSPLHGSPHVHQWLADGERLGLVDFDRIALGPPELDVATFLAEMDFENPEMLPVDAICRAFVAGYEATGEKLDRDRLQLYRAHKRFAKAFKAAKSLRARAAQKVRRHLAFAGRCLENPQST